MIAPIVKSVDSWNNMVNDFEIWLPPGEWIETSSHIKR